MITDLELWKQIVQDDKAAFEVLYRRYYSALFAYALRLRFDKETIKDCIQDLFVKLYLNRRELPALSYVKPYLYRSLTNSLLDKVKSVGSHTVDLDELAHLSMEDEGLVALFKHNDRDFMQAMQLKNALNQLPAKQKSALYFRFIQDFSWEEMAEMFKMSQHSCMNLVGRSIAKMRDLLEKE